MVPLLRLVAQQLHHGFICLLARNFIMRKNLVPDFYIFNRGHPVATSVPTTSSIKTDRRLLSAILFYSMSLP